MDKLGEVVKFASKEKLMESSAEYARRYRERTREKGVTELLLRLPIDVVEKIDRIRTERGVANRSATVASLINQALEGDVTKHST